MRTFAIALTWLNLLALASAETKFHFLEPHPLAGTLASDEDLAGMLGHYGKPPTDCEADEQAFQISGVPGMVRKCSME